MKKELQIGDDTSKPQTLAASFGGRGWSCIVYKGVVWRGDRVKPQSFLSDHACGPCRCTPPAQGTTTAGTPRPTHPPRRLAAPTPPPSTWQVWGLTQAAWSRPGVPVHTHLTILLSTDGSLHPSAELWSAPGQAGFGPMLGGGSSPLPLPAGGSSSVGGSGGFGSLHQHERMVSYVGGPWQVGGSALV